MREHSAWRFQIKYCHVFLTKGHIHKFIVTFQKHGSKSSIYHFFTQFLNDRLCNKESDPILVSCPIMEKLSKTAFLEDKTKPFQICAETTQYEWRLHVCQTSSPKYPEGCQDSLYVFELASISFECKTASTNVCGLALWYALTTGKVRT